MRRAGVCLAAVFVLATSGCAERVNVEAERDILRQLEIGLRQAVAAKDIESALSYFADDTWILLSNAPIIEGKTALRVYMSEAISNPGFDISTKVVKTEVARANDLGYTLVAYQVRADGPEGSPVTDRGNLLRVWKRQQDGTWKVVVEIVNSDQPPPTATE